VKIAPASQWQRRGVARFRGRKTACLMPLPLPLEVEMHTPEDVHLAAPAVEAPAAPSADSRSLDARDAARYRWLRAGHYPLAFARAVLNDTPHGIDAAIDTAMESRTGRRVAARHGRMTQHRPSTDPPQPRRP
jgi:hypothetical protein